MNKQEQIEEMAKIIDELYNVYDTTAGDIAEGLYNAGYRKTFTSELASDTQNAFKDGYIKGSVDRMIEAHERNNEARKETAKEILLLLGKGYDETEKTEFNNLQWYKEFCRELKHRYGVEVEE